MLFPILYDVSCYYYLVNTSMYSLAIKYEKLYYIYISNRHNLRSKSWIQGKLDYCNHISSKICLNDMLHVLQHIQHFDTKAVFPGVVLSFCRTYIHARVFVSHKVVTVKTKGVALKKTLINA